MKRLLSIAVLFITLVGWLAADPLPVTPFTVIAKVKSFEHYRAVGGERFGPDTPYGNEDTIVAIILKPESLAGREIAIPFESRKERKELFVKPGTVFRFEHALNLADLRYKTDNVQRRAIGFPELGVIVLKPDGEVGEAYEGYLTPLIAAASEKKTQAPR